MLYMGMPVTPLAYSAPMCGIGGRRLYIIITPGMKYYDVIINPYLLIGCNSQISSCPVLLLSDSPPSFPAWVYGWCQGCCKSFVCIQYGQEERSAQDPVAISARIRMVLSRSVLCPVWLSSLLPPRAFSGVVPTPGSLVLFFWAPWPTVPYWIFTEI